MPKFLMAVWGPADYGEHSTYESDAEMRESFAETGRFNDRLAEQGYLVYADGLEAASTSTTVDGRGDQPVVTDGPYVDADEYINGFWVIDVPDRETAVQLAGEASRACRATIEVRPFNTGPLPE